MEHLFAYVGVWNSPPARSPVNLYVKLAAYQDFFEILSTLSDI